MFIKASASALILLMFLSYSAGPNRSLAHCIEASGNVLVFSKSEAQSAIKAAEDRILICYKAVSDAASSGANMSTLLPVLNEAGALYSKAKLAYQNGDFDSATNLATSCVSKLGNFVDDANLLEQEGSRQQYLGFVILAASIVATVLALFVSAIAWIILNRTIREPRVSK